MVSPCDLASHVKEHLLSLVREVDASTKIQESRTCYVYARHSGGLTLTYNPLPLCSCEPSRCPLLYTTHVPLTSQIQRRLGSLTTAERAARLLSAVEKAQADYNLVASFLRLYGCESVPTDQQKITFITTVAAYALAELSEDYLKAKFNHIACLLLGQTEFPPPPTFLHPLDRVEVLFGGATHAFLRMECHRTNLSMGQGMTQLKKGAPSVSDVVLSEKSSKCVTSLTTAKLSPENDRLAPLLAHEVERTVDEMFPVGWYKGEQPIYVPSRSSHMLSGKKTLGGLGRLVCSLDQDDYGVQYSLRCPKTSRLSIEQPVSYLEWCHTQVRQMALSFPEWFVWTQWWALRLSRVISLPKVDCSNIFRAAGSLALRMEERMRVVKPMALAEPFKVRVITLGPTGTYYRAKYIQKSVHRHLRQHICASLIGATITSEGLSQGVHAPGPGEFYVSGDYSAATDNLDPRLSEAAARRIALNAGWSADYAQLFVDCLVNHNILDYPRMLAEMGKDAGKRLEAYFNTQGAQNPEVADYIQPQRWGQLMGSPVSFPVLCIVNLALTRYSQEQTYQRYIPLRKSGIMINGDDIGFVTTQEGYRNWSRITSAGGLSPSPGKNFTSTQFIVLNSTMFKVRESPVLYFNEAIGEYREDHFEEVPYINFGLLNCGGWRGEGLTTESKKEACMPQLNPAVPTVGSLAHALIKGHPEVMQVKLLKEFLQNWKPVLEKTLPRGMSYFLPVHLGGLGIPSVGDYSALDGMRKERYSRAQRVMASMLDHDPERQSRLQSVAGLGRKDDYSLWKRIQRPMKAILGRFRTEYTRDVVSPDPIEGRIRSVLLSQAVSSEDPEAEDFFAEDSGSKEMAAVRDEKYLQWRADYESLFKLAERSTFVPFSDFQINSSRPWRINYCLPDGMELEDHTQSVDLRNSFGQELR